MTLDLACPTCGQPSFSQMTAPVTHICCATCGGRGLHAAAAKMLLLDVGKIPAPEVGQAVGKSTPSDSPCFLCNVPSVNVVIRDQNCVLCKSCGAMWLPKGAMTSLSDGQWGEDNVAAPEVDIGFSSPALDLALTSPTSQNPMNVEPVASGQFAPPPVQELELSQTRTSSQRNEDRLAGMQPLPSLDVKTQNRSTRKKKGIVEGTGNASRGSLSPVAKFGVVAALMVAVVISIFVVVLVSSGPEKAPDRVALSPEMLVKKYEVYFLNYPFGGRKLNWWQNALMESSPGGAFADADRHRLLKERIALLDLVIVDTGETTKVKVSEKITQEIIRYLELK